MIWAPKKKKHPLGEISPQIHRSPPRHDDCGRYVLCHLCGQWYWSLKNVSWYNYTFPAKCCELEWRISSPLKEKPKGNHDAKTSSSNLQKVIFQAQKGRAFVEVLLQVPKSWFVLLLLGKVLKTSQLFVSRFFLLVWCMLFHWEEWLRVNPCTCFKHLVFAKWFGGGWTSGEERSHVVCMTQMSNNGTSWLKDMQVFKVYTSSCFPVDLENLFMTQFSWPHLLGHKKIWHPSKRSNFNHSKWSCTIAANLPTFFGDSKSPRQLIDLPPQPG